MDHSVETSQSPGKKSFRGKRALVVWGGLLALVSYLALVGLALLTKTADRGVLIIAVIALGILILTCFMIVRFFRWFCNWRNLQRVLFGLACLGTLIALFYAVENWRGKRAWEQCKREFETKGHSLDWSTYLPPPVPDEQNVFKAPRMQEWFVGRGSSELDKRLGRFERGRGRVAVLTVVFPGQTIVPGDADLVLQFNEPKLTLADSLESAPASQPQPALIPVIELNDVPLSKAIQRIWQLSKVNYPLDMKAIDQVRNEHGEVLKVSLSWENVTAREALLTLLKNYHLRLVDNPTAGMARVEPIPSSGPEIEVNPLVRERLNALIDARRPAMLTNGPTLKSTRDFTFVLQPTISNAPARVVLRTETQLSAGDIHKFFSTAPVNSVRVEKVDSNTFDVLVISAPYPAADFIAWSDQFQPDLDAIRQALTRPHARMEGDYYDAMKMPIPRFVTIRNVAQTLGDRAKCYLLLGRPEEALREVSLIHDLSKLLEGPPTGKPITLVAAMINVAVAGLYADTIADGFKLHAWREPQWIALQKQLGEVNLLPPVHEAFRSEPAAMCQFIENSAASNMGKLISSKEKTGLKKVLDPFYLTFALGPRGWRYQNIATIVRVQGPTIETIDLEHNLIHPRNAVESVKIIEDICRHPSPYTMMAAIAIPNYSRASTVLAHNQTMAHLALIACALERYRLEHQEYPETLDALSPKYLEKVPVEIIGGEPLKYHRVDGGKFTLYSVGWNEKDDGGVPNKEVKNVTARYEQDDWVWQ